LWRVSGRVVRVRETEYVRWGEARDVPLTGSYRPQGRPWRCAQCQAIMYAGVCCATEAM